MNIRRKELLISFALYSLLGWCIDTIARSLTLGTFKSDNMLGFPFSPMYGFAALGILWIGHYIKQWKLWQQSIFFMFVAGAYEYAGGVISEWFLGRRLWNYTHFPMDFHGYTDPLHAFIWGLLSITLLHWIHPYVRRVLHLSKR